MSIGGQYRADPQGGFPSCPVTRWLTEQVLGPGPLTEVSRLFNESPEGLDRAGGGRAEHGENAAVLDERVRLSQDAEPVPAWLLQCQSAGDSTRPASTGFKTTYLNTF